MKKSIIWSVNEVKKFINILPKLTYDEVYVALLAARKKYDSKLPRSEELLNRKIIKDNKHILSKIKQLSYVENIYTDKDGRYINPNAMVMLFKLNPCSTLKATPNIIKKLVDKYSVFMNTEKNEMLNSNSSNNHRNSYPFFTSFRYIDTIVFSEIHKTTSNKYWYIVDIDSPNISLVKAIGKKLSTNGLEFSNDFFIHNTRSGFHILVRNIKLESPSEYKTTGELLWKEFSKINNVELKHDTTSIPGTLQGGVKIKFINKLW